MTIFHGTTPKLLIVLAVLVGVSGANVFSPWEGHAHGLEDEVAALEAKVATLEAQIATLLPLAAISQYVTIKSSTLNGLSGPHVIFEGANVHIRSGSFPPIDGLGNLVVGNNEKPTGRLEVGDRGGSNNLIIGDGHKYRSFNGLVAGSHNTISSVAASVTGGILNTASNASASVSGGWLNEASGSRSSVSGGRGNVAKGSYSSVSGGWGNTASGENASVSGGHGNLAKGMESSVRGGSSNSATVHTATVSGGGGLTANTDASHLP